MQGIIDSHVHRYPDEIIADPVAWAASRGERYWSMLTGPGSPQGWSDRARMLADMDAAGVAHAVIQGWYWEHQETCDEMNAWHAAWAAADPGRFSVLASVQPAAGKAAVKGLLKALDEGCAGIGELHPWVQGWSLHSDTWLEIARICQERKLPVCFHATESVGRAYLGKTATPLQDYVDFATEFPEIKVVLAHWGGGLPFFYLGRNSGKLLANLHFDTAASPLLYEPRVWKAVTALAGSDRVLFGSDYPLRLRPKRGEPHQFASIVREALENLAPGDVEAVMRRNATRVYGIPEA